MYLRAYKSNGRTVYEVLWSHQKSKSVEIITRIWKYLYLNMFMLIK
jgi:hypothetical protein